MASYTLRPQHERGTHPEVIEAIMDPLRGRDGMKLIEHEPIPTSTVCPPRCSAVPR